ncbi:pentapeptide repeat-containing protein [Actinoplanes sp. NPDC026619]|uniref:pentapeptide repeat-containing protein n=1 Tax=Actinoplanes sp. NPDC026619 TaxID=3155798 RepID=UPI0033E366CF
MRPRPHLRRLLGPGRSGRPAVTLGRSVPRPPRLRPGVNTGITRTVHRPVTRTVHRPVTRTGHRPVGRRPLHRHGDPPGPGRPRLRREPDRQPTIRPRRGFLHIRELPENRALLRAKTLDVLRYGGLLRCRSGERLGRHVVLRRRAKAGSGFVLLRRGGRPLRHGRQRSGPVHARNRRLLGLRGSGIPLASRNGRPRTRGRSSRDRRGRTCPATRKLPLSADTRDRSTHRATRASRRTRPALLRPALLRPALLRPALLRRAVLRDALLRPALLRPAVLRRAVLRRAVLRDALLRRAVLRDALLRRAVLRDALLRRAVLRDAVLRRADLRVALLRRRVGGGWDGTGPLAGLAAGRVAGLRRDRSGGVRPGGLDARRGLCRLGRLPVARAGNVPRLRRSTELREQTLNACRRRPAGDACPSSVRGSRRNRSGRHARPRLRCGRQLGAGLLVGAGPLLDGRRQLSRRWQLGAGLLLGRGRQWGAGLLVGAGPLLSGRRKLARRWQLSAWMLVGCGLLGAGLLGAGALLGGRQLGDRRDLRGRWQLGDRAGRRLAGLRRGLAARLGRSGAGRSRRHRCRAGRGTGAVLDRPVGVGLRARSFRGNGPGQATDRDGRRWRIVRDHRPRAVGLAERDVRGARAAARARRAVGGVEAGAGLPRRLHLGAGLPCLLRRRCGLPRRLHARAGFPRLLRLGCGLRGRHAGAGFPRRLRLGCRFLRGGRAGAGFPRRLRLGCRFLRGGRAGAGFPGRLPLGCRFLCGWRAGAGFPRLLCLRSGRPGSRHARARLARRLQPGAGVPGRIRRLPDGARLRGGKLLPGRRGLRVTGRARRGSRGELAGCGRLLRTGRALGLAGSRRALLGRGRIGPGRAGGAGRGRVRLLGRGKALRAGRRGAGCRAPLLGGDDRSRALARRVGGRHGGDRWRADHAGRRGGRVGADHAGLFGFGLLDDARNRRRLLAADDPAHGGWRGLAEHARAVAGLTVLVVVLVRGGQLASGGVRLVVPGGLALDVPGRDAPAVLGPAVLAGPRLGGDLVPAGRPGIAARLVTGPSDLLVTGPGNLFLAGPGDLLVLARVGPAASADRLEALVVVADRGDRRPSAVAPGPVVGGPAATSSVRFGPRVVLARVALVRLPLVPVAAGSPRGQVGLVGRVPEGGAFAAATGPPRVRHTRIGGVRPPQPRVGDVQLVVERPPDPWIGPALTRLQPPLRTGTSVHRPSPAARIRLSGSGPLVQTFRIGRPHTRDLGAPAGRRLTVLPGIVPPVPRIHTTPRLPGNAPTLRSGGTAVLRSGHAIVLWSDSTSTLRSRNATVLRSGDAAVLRSGDAAVLRSGDAAVLRSGHAAVLRSGHAAVLRSGHAAVLRSGHAAVLRSGHAAVLRSGDASTLRTSDATVLRPGSSPTLLARNAVVLRPGTSPTLLTRDPAVLRSRNTPVLRSRNTPVRRGHGAALRTGARAGPRIRRRRVLSGHTGLRHDRTAGRYRRARGRGLRARVADRRRCLRAGTQRRRPLGATFRGFSGPPVRVGVLLAAEPAALLGRLRGVVLGGRALPAGLRRQRLGPPIGFDARRRLRLGPRGRTGVLGGQVVRPLGLVLTGPAGSLATPSAVVGAPRSFAASGGVVGPCWAVARRGLVPGPRRRSALRHVAGPGGSPAAGRPLLVIPSGVADPLGAATALRSVPGPARPVTLRRTGTRPGPPATLRGVAARPPTALRRISIALRRATARHRPAAATGFVVDLAGADGGGRLVAVSGQVTVVERLVDVVGEVAEPVVAALAGVAGAADREVRRVEVGAQLGAVEVDVGELVAGQVGDRRVDRGEVGVVEPARPLRVERGLRVARRAVTRGTSLPAGRELVHGAVGRAGSAGGNDRVGGRPFLELTFLNDRRIRHNRILRVFVVPVFVVLVAHAAAPRAGTRRRGVGDKPQCRIVPPVVDRPSTRMAPPSGGCGRLTTLLRPAPAPSGARRARRWRCGDRESAAAWGGLRVSPRSQLRAAPPNSSNAFPWAR